MNAIVYSFIHSINHSNHLTDIYWLKMSIYQPLSKHQGCKDNRCPNPTMWFFTCRPGSYSSQQTWREKEMERVELKKKKNCCNCQLVLKEWPHKWSHMHRKWKKCLTFYLKKLWKSDVWLLPGPPPSFQHLFTKPHSLIVFQCPFPEGWSIFWNPFTSSSHLILCQAHISSAKSFGGENQLD